MFNVIKNGLGLQYALVSLYINDIQNQLPVKFNEELEYYLSLSFIPYLPLDDAHGVTYSVNLSFLKKEITKFSFSEEQKTSNVKEAREKNQTYIKNLCKLIKLEDDFKDYFIRIGGEEKTVGKILDFLNNLISGLEKKIQETKDNINFDNKFEFNFSEEKDIGAIYIFMRYIEYRIGIILENYKNNELQQDIEIITRKNYFSSRNPMEMRNMTLGEWCEESHKYDIPSNSSQTEIKKILSERIDCLNAKYNKTLLTYLSQKSFVLSDVTQGASAHK